MERQSDCRREGNLSAKRGVVDVGFGGLVTVTEGHWTDDQEIRARICLDSAKMPSGGRPPVKAGCCHRRDRPKAAKSTPSCHSGFPGGLPVSATLSTIDDPRPPASSRSLSSTWTPNPLDF